jgi:RNA polymerase sigma-70 factor (ECF subfamily)
MCSVAAGDRAALAALYRQIGAYLRVIARNSVLAREDSEEIVFDVFTHVWRFAGSYDPKRGSVRSWLAVMTRNRRNDVLRKCRSMLSVGDPQAALIEDLTSGGLGPEDLLVRHELRLSLIRALEKLSPLRREVLGLSFFEGLPHQEIANRIGMPLGTVKSHLRRALAALRVDVSDLDPSAVMLGRPRKR